MKRPVNIGVIVLGCLMLSSCGSGGGSTVNPTPPPPKNSSLSNLQYSESFTSDAASSSTHVSDVTSALTQSASSTRSSLTISYDASSQSYTLSDGSLKQTFSPADRLPQQANGTSEFRKGSGSALDYFFFVQPAANGLQYSSLGEWQHGGQTDLGLRFFTYGVPTAASATPRTGSAGYLIYVTGFYSPIGSIPKTTVGSGTFTADFLSGLFSTDAYVDEKDVIGTSGTSSYHLLAGGKLSSTDGTFSGNISYAGSQGALAGSVYGRFYGPSAQEVGAAFNADGPDGSSLAGAFVGKNDTSNVQIKNLTLNNIIADQYFYAQGAQLTAETLSGTNTLRPSGSLTVREGVGSVNVSVNGNVAIGTLTSDLPSVTLTSADKTSSTGNFVTYQKDFNGTPIEVKLYKTGSSNSELALTYTSFATWKATVPNGFYSELGRVFLTYGIETPSDALSRRTGTAHYDGVVYGAGANGQQSAVFDLKGTSSFDMDFGLQHYSGALTIGATNIETSAQLDLGRFDFSGSMPGNNAFAASLMQGGSAVGSLTTKFYGPNGEELAGSFQATILSGAAADASIAGITVAKSH